MKLFTAALLAATLLYSPALCDDTSRHAAADAPAPIAEKTEVTSSQVVFLVADSAEVMPIDVEGAPRVSIIAKNLDVELKHGVMVEVVNQPNRFIAVYKILDPKSNLVAFPPQYLQPVEGKESTYLIIGDPGDAYWVEVRSNEAPIVVKVEIEGDKSPPIGEPIGDFKSLEENARALVTALAEHDVQSALHAAYASLSLDEPLSSGIKELLDTQESVLRKLGAAKQLDKDWFAGWVQPIDAELDALVSSGAIKTSADLSKAVSAIASGILPAVPAKSVVGTSFSVPDDKQEKSTITFYTGPGCIWCERWKRDELPKLEKAGWVVDPKSASPGKSIPYFDIKLPGKQTIRHDGYLDMPTLRKLMGLGSSAAIIPPSAYKPRWTNSDGLSFEEHARVWHGIDTTGKTLDEIARLRDADHDKYGPGHPAVMRRAR